MNTIDANYDQLMLFPPCIEDWVTADHPARFIREVVEQMDLKEVISDEADHQITGRPSYSDRLLLRVWLMGYWRGIRSVRKLEQACQESLPFVWLTGNNAPDHSTLWRFFRRNRTHLRAFFKQTVMLAREMNLVDFVMQAVDGTKIKAACTPYVRTDKSSLEKLLSRLNSRINELESQVSESFDGGQEGASHLPKELSDHQRLRSKVSAALQQLKAGGASHCHPQELEARRMECTEGNQYAYNAQAVVDAKKQIVLAAEVVNSPGDSSCLHPMIQEAERITGVRAGLTLADAGYSSSAQLAKCAESGNNVLAPLHTSAANTLDSPYHSSNFRYDSSKDVVICPQGQELTKRRRRKDGNVVSSSYRNTKACAQCQVREVCTQSSFGRDIEIREGHEQVQKLRKQLKDPQCQALLRQRSRIVEPVFAQIKSNGNFRRWTRFGLDNARSQWHLLCGMWNLHQIYATWRTS
jgi:transposase